MRSGGHERSTRGRVHHGEAAANGGERGVDAGPDLIAQHDAARTGGEGRGDVSGSPTTATTGMSSVRSSASRASVFSPSTPASHSATSARSRSTTSIDPTCASRLESPARSSGSSVSSATLIGSVTERAGVVDCGSWAHVASTRLTRTLGSLHDDVQVNPARTGRTDVEIASGLDEKPARFSVENLSEQRICGVLARRAELRIEKREFSRMANHALDVFPRARFRPSPPLSPPPPPVVHVSPRPRPGGTGIVWADDLVDQLELPLPRPTTVGIAHAPMANLDERDAEVIGRDAGTDSRVLRVAGGGLTPAHVPRARRPRGRQPRARDRPPRAGPRAPRCARSACSAPRSTPRTAARSIATSSPIARSRAASRAAR